MSGELQGAKLAACQTSTLVLSNAADLVASVVKDIAGVDVAESLNGESLTREVVADMSCRMMVEEICAAKV